MTKAITSIGTLRAWGNSIGITLPKAILEQENLSVNDEVEITVKKKTNPLRKYFGKLQEFKPRSKLTTDQLLKQIDKEFESRLE